ncbi:MAG: hypothetical protein RLZZ399_2031 [Verrucomicrobiota bacterium]|jgi:membrane protease YdiL (CAAX protease family)
MSLSPDLTSRLLLLLLALPVLGGAGYYLAAIGELRARGSRVSTQYFGVPDVFFGGSLAAYFAWTGWAGLLRQEPSTDLTPNRLLGNSVFMLLLLAVVVFFARARRVPVGPALGWVSDHFPSAFLRAMVFLGTALPMVWAINLASRMVFPDQNGEQGMVSLFRAASESGNWSTVWAVGISAVFVAPLVEESVFRGYFYPTLKRYCGPVVSALFTSLLFAFSHGNLAVMAGLFSLSLCLTVSYERHGSLWVPIGMHAGFNAMSLGMLYLQGRGWIPT